MALDPDREVWRMKDARAWRIGRQADFAWIEDGTRVGLEITSAVPPVFEAYATLELPGTGDQTPTPPENQDRHDAHVISVLTGHTSAQSWWLGYLDTGGADIIFDDVRKVGTSWRYVLIQAGPEQASTWRDDGHWKGVLPDLMFPADRSWLFSTLWDDDWTCVGGSRGFIDAFLNHPDLKPRAREIKTLIEDATPPGHIAI
jgi:hypothetical protein